MDASVWAIVLAGGGGNRFGGLKQFAELSGQTLLDRVVQLAGKSCDGVVVVLPAAQAQDGQYDQAGQIIATGGATRAESVRSGLAALPPGATIVVITDAAHPLASAILYERVIAAVRAGADGALPGLPLADAIKRLEPVGSDATLLGLAGATTAAGGNVSAQMPMAFRRQALHDAHARIGDAVEDSAMVTAAGGRVVVVPGEPTNVHVTTPAELAIAVALLPLV
jgi:2-C-methyl-D-erythritol 4-phosphate cytidylyltransferase